MRARALATILLLSCAPAFAQGQLDIPASEAADDEDVAAAPAKPEKKAPEKPAAKAEKEKQTEAEMHAPPAALPDPNTAMLQGLNKVTGRISTLEIPLGTIGRFGNLEIIARRCVRSLPEEQPENSAFLEIRELRSGESPQQIFLGWMFSSSPGLSGLEHPVYDITVLSCDHKKEYESDIPELPKPEKK